MEELVRVVTQSCGGAPFRAIEPSLFRMCHVNRGLVPFLIYTICTSNREYGEPSAAVAVSILDYIYDNVASFTVHSGRMYSAFGTIDTIIRLTGGACMPLLFKTKFRDVAVRMAALRVTELPRLPREQADRALSTAIAERLVDTRVICADHMMRRYRRLRCAVRDSCMAEIDKHVVKTRPIEVEVCPLGNPDGVCRARIERILRKLEPVSYEGDPIRLTLSACAVACPGVLWNVAGSSFSVSPRGITGYSSFWLDLIVRHGMQLNPWAIMSSEREAFLSLCDEMLQNEVG